MALIIEGDFSEGWAQRAKTEYPESVYETKLVSADKNDGGNIALGFEVQGGDYNGAKIVKTIGADTTKKGNKAQWVSLLVATGTPEEKAKAAKKFDVEKLFGKTVHLYVRPAAEGEKYGDRNIVHPDDIKDMIKAFGKNGVSLHGNTKSGGSSNGNGKSESQVPQPDEGSSGSDELDLG